MPRTPCTTAILLAALFFVSVFARSAEPEPPTDAFFSRVEVHRVNVDVVVTDDRGAPVRGLERSDFRLAVDGREVPILNFYAVETEEPAKTAAERSDEIPVAGSTAAAETGPRELSLVLYVDNFHLRPAHRRRVLTSLREVVAGAGGGWERMMVVSYDRTLDVVQPFTADRQAIVRALHGLEGTAAYGTQADADRLEALQAIEESRDASRVVSQIRQVAEERRSDLEFAIEALREFVRSLGGLPGRKVVVYVSDGLQMNTAAELVAAARERFGDAVRDVRLGDYQMSRSFQSVIDAANSSRTSFYMLDAAGLRTGLDFDLRRMTPGPGGLVDATHRNNLQAPLMLLADTTGGRAVMNTNDVGIGLDRMIRDLGNYYSLAFAPPGGGDERYHRIRVEVERRGVSVRHREGYRLKDVATRMREGTQAVLEWGVERNPLEVRARFGPARSSAGGYNLVPLEILMPIERVTLLPDGDRRRGQIEIYLSARDASGGVSPVARESVPLSVPVSELEGVPERPLRYRTEVRMRSGPHLVGIGVLDVPAAASSFVRVPVDVGGT